VRRQTVNLAINGRKTEKIILLQYYFDAIEVLQYYYYEIF